MELLKSYFPGLSAKQLAQFEQLPSLYNDWNARINVISRKDMDNFEIHHVLHSLAIAKVMEFLPGASVMDVGTGGGFPGIPLAVLFPETEFLLVDSIGKKILVVNEVAKKMGLHNVRAIHARAETVQERFDFVVSRAVTALPDFLPWVSKSFKPQSRHVLANGILYLKGGELSEELSKVKKTIQLFELSQYFAEPFFETKKVVYVKMG